MTDISIIVPVLNEEQNVKPLYDQITKVMNKIKKSYEVIYVDDGSKDRTFQNLKQINKKDSRLKVISFRRNYGKAAALSAGFELAQGNIVITMDGDLQDDPEEIPRFLKVMDMGYDLVSGWKKTKHQGTLKVYPSKIFNILTRQLTGVRLHDFNCPFKAYKNEVVKNIVLYGELHRYIPVFAHWNGYRIAEIPVKNYERKFGFTKYSTGRILQGFMDLITVKFMSSYQLHPLHLFGTLGAMFAALGGLAGLYLTYLWILGHGIGSRPLLMLAVLMMVLGVQFASMGLIAEMITHSNQKHEKSYSVKKILK